MFVYYASYLYVIAAPVALWLAIKNSGALRWFAVIMLASMTILAYARFIEPRILLTADHEVELNGCFDRAGDFRVTVFSDVHQGIFGNAVDIDRIAGAVNKTNPDFVFIPGDFVYHLEPERFDQFYAAFAAIKAPVLAVLGNHDLGLPGPDLSEPLNKTLPALGIRMIDDQALKLSNSKFEIEVVGISDEWARAQDLELLERPQTSPRLVLTHHPETIFLFEPTMRADLLVGGHTHGGQIQLPFITCWLTKICGDHAYGLRQEKDTHVFTTSGTGMVGLPMRFRVPPRVDVLNVRYNACAAQ